MINIKKVVATTLLLATVVGFGGNVAKAGEKWTCGLHNFHNGYYMAYGYYYHGESTHYSWATLADSATSNCDAPAGQTSQANTQSRQSMSYQADKGVY